MTVNFQDYNKLGQYVKEALNDYPKHSVVMHVDRNGEVEFSLIPHEKPIVLTNAGVFEHNCVPAQGPIFKAGDKTIDRGLWAFPPELDLDKKTHSQAKKHINNI